MEASRRLVHETRWLRREATKRVPSWRFLGENIGAAYAEDPNELPASIEHLHRSFIASASHRENLDDPQWNALGIAVLRTEDGRVWVVEHFARVG